MESKMEKPKEFEDKDEDEETHSEVRPSAEAGRDEEISEEGVERLSDEELEAMAPPEVQERIDRDSFDIAKSIYEVNERFEKGKEAERAGKESDYLEGVRSEVGMLNEADYGRAKEPGKFKKFIMAGTLAMSLMAGYGAMGARVAEAGQKDSIEELQTQRARQYEAWQIRYGRMQTQERRMEHQREKMQHEQYRQYHEIWKDQMDEYEMRKKIERIGGYIQLGSDIADAIRIFTGGQPQEDREQQQGPYGPQRRPGGYDPRGGGYPPAQPRMPRY